MRDEPNLQLGCAVSTQMPAAEKLPEQKQMRRRRERLIRNPTDVNRQDQIVTIFNSSMNHAVAIIQCT